MMLQYAAWILTVAAQPPLKNNMPCNTYTCPSGYQLRWNAADTYCYFGDCTANDTDTCCRQGRFASYAWRVYAPVVGDAWEVGRVRFYQADDCHPDSEATTAPGNHHAWRGWPNGEAFSHQAGHGTVASRVFVDDPAPTPYEPSPTRSTWTSVGPCNNAATPALHCFLGFKWESDVNRYPRGSCKYNARNDVSCIGTDEVLGKNSGVHIACVMVQQSETIGRFASEIWLQFQELGTSLWRTAARASGLDGGVDFVFVAGASGAVANITTTSTTLAPSPVLLFETFVATPTADPRALVWGPDPGSLAIMAGAVSDSMDGEVHEGGTDIFVRMMPVDGDNATSFTFQTGTAAADVTNALAVDALTNVFVAGSTAAALHGQTHQGDNDFFLSKINTGGLVWTIQKGRPGDDVALAIALGSGGEVFVVGYTSSNLEGEVHNGAHDAFIMKVSADSTTAWTMLKGTADNDEALAVAVDSSNNVLVAGFTTGSIDGATHAGGADILVMKITDSGVSEWSFQHGTAGDDAARGIAVNSAGDVFIVGTASGSLDGEPFAGEVDMFLMRLNSTGAWQWTAMKGNSEQVIGQAVVVNLNEDLLVTGTTFGSLDSQPTLGLKDAFLMQFNSTGSWDWTILLGGGRESDEGRALSVSHHRPGQVAVALARATDDPQATYGSIRVYDVSALM